MRRIPVAMTFVAVLAWGASAKAQGGTCSHDECEVGDPLTEDCSVCAEAVCGSDTYCCSEAWDEECVELADFLCNWCGGDDEGTSDGGGDDHDGAESSGDDGADDGNGDDAQDDSPGPGGDDDDDSDDDDDDDDEADDDDDDEDRGKNDKNDEPVPGGSVPPVARGGDAEGCSIGSGHDRSLALLGLVLWLGARRRRRA